MRTNFHKIICRWLVLLVLTTKKLMVSNLKLVFKSLEK